MVIYFILVTVFSIIEKTRIKRKQLRKCTTIIYVWYFIFRCNSVKNNPNNMQLLVLAILKPYIAILKCQILFL